MNIHSGLLAAAVSGLMLGASACASNAAEPEVASASGGEAHSCKGQNACKGQGNCKTESHACKGHNECKGQGGCKAG